jgi:MFS transporter, SET family, sugar efflux transporter
VGLQFAFLNPVLALLLVTLFDAITAEVGWVFAVYNAGGFIASLVIPGRADRSANYLRPMLICAVLTVALAGVLSVTTSLPLAVIAVVVLGGPSAGTTAVVESLSGGRAIPSGLEGVGMEASQRSHTHARGCVRGRCRAAGAWSPRSSVASQGWTKSE